MRSLRAVTLFAMALLSGPILAAERLTLGNDQVVIDGKNAFVNGKKVSCKELSETIHETWGSIVFDENCVRSTFRIAPAFDNAVMQKKNYTDGQWLYRAGEQVGPVAVFMDWQYSRIVFRGTCQIGRVMALIYFDDEGTKLKRGDKMMLLLDGRRYDMVADTVSEGLYGQITVTPALKDAIARAKVISIDVRSKMRVPWYLGGAPALKRLAKECSENPWGSPR